MGGKTLIRKMWIICRFFFGTLPLVFTYFALFTYYEDDIFEVISNLHVQGSKFGGKIKKFDRKSLKKVELHGVHGVRFFQVCICIPPLQIDMCKTIRGKLIIFRVRNIPRTKVHSTHVNKCDTTAA